MSWRRFHLLQALILAGWGVFILEKVWSGKVSYFINQRFVLLIFGTGLVFFTLALAVFRSQTNKKDPSGHGHGEEHVGDSSSSQPPSWSLLILMLPLLLGMAVAPRPLGSSAMANRGVNMTAPLSKLRTSSATALQLSSSERSVLDWVGDFNSISDPSSYVGQVANVTGFVYHDPRLGKDQFLVSRFVVTCCVADAQALGMVVDWPGSDRLADNSWVNVQGKIKLAELNGQKVPGISAGLVKPIPAPDQPYLSPN